MQAFLPIASPVNMLLEFKVFLLVSFSPFFLSNSNLAIFYELLNLSDVKSEKMDIFVGKAVMFYAV